MTSDQPGQQEDTREADDHLCRQTPAGLLNSVVHDFPVIAGLERDGRFAALFPGPEPMLNTISDVPSQLQKWQKHGRMRFPYGSRSAAF
jgi:hypothetical protein